MNNIHRPWARNRNPDGQQQPDEPVIIIINERDLRIFIFRVYLCAAVLCLLSAIPWLIVSGLKTPVYRALRVPPFVWLLISFLLLTVLSCIPQRRVTRWICWGLVIGSLIFITLFGCYYACLQPVWLVAAAMVLSVALLALLHLYGAKAPHILLPNLICTCCIVIMGSVTLLVLLLMALFTKEPRYILASAIVFFIIVVVLAPIQASFICGRFQQVPYGEIASCSNGIYMHFWFLAGCLAIFATFEASDL